jgi:hypothetical protein
MINHLELSSRAALCRQLARREPGSRTYWLAEAENWLRLSHDPVRLAGEGQPDPFQHFLGLIAHSDETSGAA